jgi:hypothetical protein
MSALILTLVLASTFPAGASFADAPDKETATYEDNGVSFRYPKDWKVRAEPAKKGPLTIFAEKDGNTHAMIQIYPPEATPKLILDEMDKAFRKAFEGKLVKGSDKAAKRKLVGEERTGLAMDFEVAAGVIFTVEVLAFELPSKKNTLAVIFQTTAGSGDGGKKGRDVIADSLKEQKPK